MNWALNWQNDLTPGFNNWDVQVEWMPWEIKESFIWNKFLEAL